MLTQTEFNQTLQAYNYNKVIRRQMYKDYVKEQEVISGTTANWTIVDAPMKACTNSLAPIAVCGPYTYGCKQEEGNNPMNYASASISTPATETQDQRKYLQSRLQDVYGAKKSPLQAQFGLIDDDAPETMKDLQERIAAGKFTFLDEKDARPYHHWTEMLRWRDPAKKADQDGYTAAKTELKAKYQAALDTIKIDEPKAGLEAVKALEAWTPTGAAN